MPPASLGGSPRSASVSDLGFFQTAASVLGHGICEILCAPIKSKVCASYNPLSLVYASLPDLQNNVFLELVFLIQPLDWGAISWP